MAKIMRREAPVDSLIANEVRRAHYHDAYAVTPIPEGPDLARVGKAFFVATPGWGVWLMRLRGVVARLLGLAHPGGSAMRRQFDAFEGRLGQMISLFEVTARSRDELVFSGEDKHLTAHLAFCARGRTLTVTTTVRFHQPLGRWYFACIRPFHILIIRSTARRMAALLEMPEERWPRLVVA